tara:strand:+ start:481 stop:1092 length:612 start_codon:yes stop_codon:yes gene_type:complete
MNTNEKINQMKKALLSPAIAWTRADLISIRECIDKRIDFINDLQKMSDNMNKKRKISPNQRISFRTVKPSSNSSDVLPARQVEPANGLRMVGIPQNIVTARQAVICEEMCKAYGFNSSKDKQTRITREDALRAGPTIDKFREEIIRIYPHDCKKKIRTGEKGDLVNLTILRQLLKHHNKRIQSFRTSGKENGRGYKYRYNLLM